MQSSKSIFFPSVQILNDPVFKILNPEFCRPSSRAILSYKRAKVIALCHKLDISDIRDLTPKFWNFHLDPILALDGAAATLLTIQYNLVIGTLSKFMAEQDNLAPLIDDLLNYRLLGQFCLTEVGRGLDIFNMKTTATMLDDGRFELHTPTPMDAKFMPPTIPVLGIPCIAIVFARLVVDGEYRGNRPFLVQLNDGYSMSTGVKARQLPYRGGSKPVNHALTSFDRVILPQTALLGSISKPESIHHDFMASISRVSVGSLALASACIPPLYHATSIVGSYSLRRTVTGMNGDPVPIISFSTQKRPIFSAIALSYVLEAYFRNCVSRFMNQTDPRVKRGLAACAKAVIVLRSQACQLELSERCGAQGLFEYNQMSTTFNEVRGISIAEGDILGLSIRLVADLLLGKYELPPAADPSSLLALYELALIQECREAMVSRDSSDISAAFNECVLPSCQKIVEAIGSRMAYEAAVEAQLPRYIIDLFTSVAIRVDPSWFIDSKQLSRRDLAEMEQSSIDLMTPEFERLLKGLGVEQYITSPIISDKAWRQFQSTLPVFGPATSGALGTLETASFSVARTYL